MTLPRASLWIFFPLKKPKGDIVWHSSPGISFNWDISFYRLEIINIVLVIINNKVINAIRAFYMLQLVKNRVGRLQKGIPRNVLAKPRCFRSFVHSPHLY